MRHINRALPFPFFGHRSLAEVAETDRLLAEKRKTGRPLPDKGDLRLDVLLAKALLADPYFDPRGRAA